jgi:hypothetical protein
VGTVVLKKMRVPTAMAAIATIPMMIFDITTPPYEPSFFLHCLRSPEGTQGRLYGLACRLQVRGRLASVIHTEVKSSLIMGLSCGNTLKSP